MFVKNNFDKKFSELMNNSVFDINRKSKIMLNETIYLGYAILMSIKQNCRNFGMTTQNKHILMELNYAALLQIHFIIYIRL